MQSILLDPHHQPSASFSGAKSVNRGSRSKYQVRNNIIEEPEEEMTGQDFKDEYESAIGLDESRWETSPTKAAQEEGGEGEESEVAGGGGVLGLLYQFQKAQTDGRPGVSI
jgi:autophagy-related protein 9